jgi:Flp pilus assembly pilin Flp
MRKHSRKSGQGMTEYIIIVAIVAIGAILIVGLFGKQIKGVFSGMGSSLGGRDDASAAVSDPNFTEMNAEATAQQENMATFDDNEQE